VPLLDGCPAASWDASSRVDFGDHTGMALLLLIGARIDADVAASVYARAFMESVPG